MPFYADSPFTIPSGAVSVTVDSTSTLVTGGTLDWIGRPSVKQRSDGAWILVYYRATAHAANDGAIYIRFSDDYGATWTAENTALAADGGGAISGFPLNPTPVATGADAFEPWLVATYTPDEFLLHTWNYNYPTDNGGTYQWRTTDGGVTWTAEGGPVEWGGMSLAAYARTIATDQDLVLSSTTFVGARYYNDPDQDPCGIVFCSTTDKGATWTRLDDLVLITDLSGHGTQEIGFTRVGNKLLSIIRDTAAITHTYAMWSDDLSGIGWGSLLDWTSQLGVLGRPRLYTRAQLKGQANWWNDPVLLLIAFEHQTPGASLDRREIIGVSRDRGATWDMAYVDSAAEDGGYSDLKYDPDNDQWVVIYYKGAFASPADLKLARLTIAGI